MKSLSKIFTIAALSVALFSASCTDNFDEMNKNPNTATTIEPKYLLTNSFRRGAMDYPTYYYTQGYANFLCQYYANSNQGHITDAYYYSDPWNATFWSRNYAEEYAGFMGMADHAMKLANEKGLVNQEGPAKIWRTFLFHRMTDIWGAIPYFEAFDDNNMVPGYTSQQDIYNDMFVQLSEGVNLINPSAGGRMETQDIIFGDDLGKWKRFGNSLRLRLAMRITNVEPQKAEQEFLAALSSTDGAMVSNSDNAGVICDAAGPAALRDENPLRVMSNYFPDWFKISETFLTMLTQLNDPRVYTYIAPRIDYLKGIQEAYTALNTNGFTPQEIGFKDEVLSVIRSSEPLFEKGADYLDKVEKFLQDKKGLAPTDALFERYRGLRNGQPPSQLSALQGTLGDYSQLSEFVKSNDYPTYFITYAEVCFLKAEAALKGWSVGGTAQQFYNDGVRAALEMYNIDESKIVDYLANVALKTTESSEYQLEQIMTQKYIANYTNGFEAWADWRRTGYPRLFTTMSLGDTEGKVPRRWMYIYDERRFNEASLNEAIEAMGGSNDMKTPNWWDNAYKTNPDKWKQVENYDYKNQHEISRK